MNFTRKFPDILHSGRIACALCGEKARLCESHIIPEFGYKRMYDKHHRMLRFSASPANSQFLQRTIQKGVREELLCLGCEQRIQKYEDYACKMFAGRTEAIRQEIEADNHFPAPAGAIFTNIDYAKFKLFSLSVLWRASVSEHPIFKGIQLGPHEDKIARMILTESPGKQLDYPFVCTENHFQKGVTPMLAPWSRREGGFQMCFLFLTGWGRTIWSWHFFVRSHIDPPEWKSAITEYFPNESGKMVVLKQISDDIPLYRGIRDLKIANRQKPNSSE